MMGLENERGRRGGRVVDGDQVVEIVDRFHGYDGERSDHDRSPQPMRRRGDDRSPQHGRRNGDRRRSRDVSRERAIRKPKMDFSMFSRGDPYE